MSFKSANNTVAIFDFQSFHLIEKFHNFSLYEKDPIKLSIHHKQVLIDFSLNNFELISDCAITILYWNWDASFIALPDSVHGLIAFFAKLS